MVRLPSEWLPTRPSPPTSSPCELESLPLLSAPGSEQITAALESVEALIVIDSLRSTAAEHADVVLAELPFFAREGTITSADRRILRQRPAAGARGEERSGIAILSALAAGLGGLFSQADAGEVMAEIAERVPSYLPYPRIASGRTRAGGHTFDDRAGIHVGAS